MADETAPSIESLLTHREWVWGLARSLVLDEARADDLEQETWLAALRSPPRSSEAARAWLGSVVRNFARRDHRVGKRRLHRERETARPVAVPSSEETLEQLELQRRLVEAVRNLREPYRQTLLLRYFHGMSPSEIARAKDVPVDSVKTRLKRAKGELRVELDGVYHGDRRAWGLAVVALCGLSPDATIPSGVTSGATSGVTASTLATQSAWTLGGLLMSTKTTLVSLTAAGILLLASGQLYLELREVAGEARAVANENEALAGQLRDAEKALEQSKRELEASLGRERSWETRYGETRDELAEERERAKKEQASVSVPESGRPSRPAAVLLAEADRLAPELASRGDIEGLWLLAAELLTLGEAGFEKVLTLAELIDPDQEGGRAFRALWRKEEQIAGRFLRAVGQHTEDLLRFGLYLSAQDPGDLPKVI